jgi:hypothetical protein
MGDFLAFYPDGQPVSDETRAALRRVAAWTRDLAELATDPEERLDLLEFAAMSDPDPRHVQEASAALRRAATSPTSAADRVRPIRAEEPRKVLFGGAPPEVGQVNPKDGVS